MAVAKISQRSNVNLYFCFPELILTMKKKTFTSPTGPEHSDVGGRVQLVFNLSYQQVGASTLSAGTRKLFQNNQS